jgi:DNA-binding NarL/FixJ family response regulator
MYASILGAPRDVRQNEAPVVLAVASDRSLIADAVAAALSRSDIDIVRVPWPGDRSERLAGWAVGTDPPDLALMLCDLTPWSIEAAQRVVASHPARWVLLTDAPRGPLWGAMLDAGVSRVVSSTTTMAEILGLVASLREDIAQLDQPDREELVGAWRRILPERVLARARLASLTKREREVLRLLHLGHTVQQISEDHGVAPSTVRSQVRSVLRKLGVNSQLAAVAHFDRWADD